MLALLLRISSKIAQKCRCKIAEFILSTLLKIYGVLVSLAPVVGIPALFVGTELALELVLTGTYARVDAAVARKTATGREGQRAFGNDLYCYALGSAICFLHFFYVVGLFHINFLAALDVKTLGETFERTVADAHALEVEDGS